MEDQAVSLNEVRGKIMEIQNKLDSPPQNDADKAARCGVVTILCLINLLANSAYSSIAPFFPKEA